jgi:hypothetical protein
MRSLAGLAAGIVLLVMTSACVAPPPRQSDPPAPTLPPAPVAAIAPPPPPPPEPRPVPQTVAPPRVSDADRLLYYYEQIAQLSPELAAQEMERTQRFHNQHRTDFTLMQLVLLKSLPSSSGKDRVQAVEWLAQFLKERKEGDSEVQLLAQLLHAQLTEQLRAEAEALALAQKLKEEARRNEELKQKLDALIDTERKMLERSKPTRNP